MYEVSEELSVTLITLWWLLNFEKFGKNYHATQKFDMERFNLRTLNELEFRKQY
jgi:hypothetical protein